METYKTKIKLIKNKKEFSRPLNQINGILRLFYKSRGEIIFLLDGDDTFKKNKLKFIFNLFSKNKKLDFVQDIPYLKNQNKLMTLEKNHTYSIWPKILPPPVV